MAKRTGVSAAEFGSLFRKFVETSMESAPRGEPHFQTALTKHFGRDPRQMASLSESLALSEHPNLQAAIDEYVAPKGAEATLGGIQGLQEYEAPRIATLLASGTAAEGPVQYANVSLDGGQVMACIRLGLYVVSGDRREAILIAAPSSRSPWDKLQLEVMAPTRDAAAATLSHIRKTMRERNVYRGRVITLVPDNYEGIKVTFHALRDIARPDVILPAGLLERIEQHAVGFSRHAAALRAAGRHLKRGMLLHGPPGTGKTLTAMYLAGQMRERTTFLLTGQGLGAIEQSCAMARLLQPSTLIIEDVDLVAEERTRQGVCENAILFELLNQMDGLSEDSDVLFVLTTNRPEILEPALASRPGRVDLAIEVPLPDLDCRRRLIDLYGRGLRFQGVELDALARKTEGVSGAFIRELLRKASLYAVDAGSEALAEQHLDTALHELTVLGGALTRAILGASSGDVRAAEA
jgi:hypothetical protein